MKDLTQFVLMMSDKIRDARTLNRLEIMQAFSWIAKASEIGMFDIDIDEVPDNAFTITYNDGTAKAPNYVRLDAFKTTRISDHHMCVEYNLKGKRKTKQIDKFQIREIEAII